MFFLIQLEKVVSIIITIIAFFSITTNLSQMDSFVLILSLSLVYE